MKELLRAFWIVITGKAQAEYDRLEANRVRRAAEIAEMDAEIAKIAKIHETCAYINELAELTSKAQKAKLEGDTETLAKLTELMIKRVEAAGDTEMVELLKRGEL